MFKISLHHEVPLAEMLEELLTAQQLLNLKKQDHGCYQYDLEAEVHSLDDDDLDIRFKPISTPELIKALNHLQTCARVSDSQKLIKASQIIWKESVEYGESREASDRAYHVADDACKNSA